MQANLSLDDLTKRVLQEIDKFGLGFATKRHYKKTYERLKEFAAVRDMDTFSEGLVGSFLEVVKGRYKAGAIGKNRRDHLRRASLLLRDYVVNETIEWKPYVFKHQPNPESQEFLLLHSRFIDNLRFYGRSENTIQSCKNSVRQFLLFLEDNGYSTLSMATVDMVPSFFQHLLATYSPTSIRTVASNIRSFLRFSENEERLLPAVPSRCARSKPIIPILSDKENDALRRVLQTQQLPLRDKAIIQLALRTGLRSVDIVGLKLSDIDWVNDMLSVAQSKTGRPFRIPLSADVGNSISAYILTERPTIDSPYVFLRSLAPFKPLCGHSACYAVVRKCFACAGIRLGLERKGIHVIRHSAASRMLEHGVPVTTISSMLGHANKSSTDVYLATNEPRMRECGLPLAGIPMNCGGLR
jgi:site-specific recombinase XerD